MIRTLAIVLGDQLTLDNPVFRDADPATTLVLMVEAPAESTHVWSTRPRTALFLAAMRHFAQAVTEAGWSLEYLRIGKHAHATLDAAWHDAITRHRPQRVACCEPGEYRVEQLLRDTCTAAGVALALLDDAHFMISRADFARWAGSSRTLLMESFYRRMRRTHRVLMDPASGGKEPLGGRWNFDEDNRGSFGRKGPGEVPSPPHFAPDAITREAIDDVERYFGDHPGSLADFGWPVTRDQALQALASFVQARLARFGETQDAMWSGQPFLFHALLSSSLNLKLLDPREVIDAAVAAHQHGTAPLAAVEGFVRQIRGWREFIRGVYWLDMPAMRTANHFGHARPLPGWYWTGDTGMNCLRQAIGQTLAHGYAHHIQRLMITGNFALLAGLSPQAVCDWYLAVYVDAVEWVELPNTAGMALFATGARFTTKPYVASGAYVKRMSNYCSGCRYDPAIRTGPGACPLSTLYWNFLIAHEAQLARLPRAVPMLRNLQRLDADERAAITAWAAQTLDRIEAL